MVGGDIGQFNLWTVPTRVGPARRSPERHCALEWQRSVSPGYAQTFDNRRARHKHFQRPGDAREVADPHQLTGLIKPDQVAHQGKVAMSAMV